MYTEVKSSSQARELAHALVSASRMYTYVVVTPTPDGSYPFDAAAIADEAGKYVKVYRIDKARDTYELTKVLGSKELSVFLGAARVYPVGAAWMTNKLAAPLYLPGPDIPQQQERLVDFALRLSYADMPLDDEETVEAKLRAEVDRLRNENEELHAELAAARGAAHVQTILKEKIVLAPAEVEPYRPDLFPTADQAFRHAVTLAWVEHVPAVAKDVHPLPAEWRIGDGFIESFETFGDDKRKKALRVIALVLSGLDKQGAVDSHQLLEAQAGKPVVRASDGAMCWRAYIEKEASAARRLHYWRLKGGVIELDRVTLHDDFEA